MLRFLESLENSLKVNPLSILVQRRNLELILNASKTDIRVMPKLIQLLIHDELMSADRDRTEAIYRYF